MLKWIFILLTFLSHVGYSQELLDSLEQQLSFVSGKDSVDMMNTIVSNAWGRSLDKADHYSNLAYAHSKLIGYQAGEITALINIGYVYSDKHRLDTAVLIFEKAGAQAKSYGFLKGVANANNALGNAYADNGDKAKAIQYYKTALGTQEQLGNEDGMSAALNNMGWSLKSLGSFNEATEYLLQALEINRRNNFIRKESLNLLGLAQIKIDQKDPALALPYLEQLTKMKGFHLDPKRKSDVYNLLGVAFTDLNKYDTAITLLKQSAEIYKAYNGYSAVPIHNLASTYLNAGQLDKALEFGLSALALKRSKNRKLSMSYTYNLLADIYLAKGLPRKSLEVSFEALQILKLQKEKSRESKTLNDISEAYESLGNYQEAFKWKELHNSLSDSLFNAKKSAQQTALLTIFENDQQKQQIDLQKAQIENQKIKEGQQEFKFYLSIAGIFVLAVALAFILWGFRKIKKANKQIAIQNSQLADLNQTKDKFFGIIAHDLRSPIIGLQSVSNQINYFLKNDQKDKLHLLSQSVEKSTSKLTELLDNLLNWALLQREMVSYHPEEVLLSNTVNQVFNLFLPLAEIKNATLINDIKEGVSVLADSKALNTILRNTIANALKYINDDNQIVVSAQYINNEVVIKVSDNGVGMSAEQLAMIFELNKEVKEGTRGEKGTGLGLVLCKELIELNKGKISIESELGKGTSVRFHLPYFENAA